MDSDSNRIIVLSPYCLLRPTTNRIFDMRMCDAFSGHGQDVSIVYPYTYMKDNIRISDIPASYGINHRVKTNMLFTPLTENSPRLWRFICMMTAFSLKAIFTAFVSLFSPKPVLVFSRDAKSLLPFIYINKILKPLLNWTLVFMAAEVKVNRIFVKVIRESDVIFAGVSSIQDAILKNIKTDPGKFILAFAPVPKFIDDIDKKEARKLIQYAQGKPLVVYTGKLGLDVQEVRLILETAALLPEVNFLFTGGRPSVVEAIKDQCRERGVGNVILTGFLKNSTQIRKYQLAADILVSYYTKADHLVEYNYPQKINEYMSTGNPVITPDFPATRDVLNSSNVFFTKPEDPEALAGSIRELLAQPDLGRKIAEQAKKDVSKLTFESRTEELLAFIRNSRAQV